MKHYGFTIVELLIVITIMGVLLILNVADLGGSQVSARDSERRTDVETIALFLDTYFTSGSLAATTVGQYPSTVWSSGTAVYMQQALGDINVQSITAPGITDPTLTLKSATNSTQTTAGVTPQPEISQYVYQPIKSDGTLCTLETQECRKFNLYYKLESNDTIYMVTSKNQ
jgi:prepilin-type N-terminal cleavage/methylation domain-containing protein